MSHKTPDSVPAMKAARLKDAMLFCDLKEAAISRRRRSAYLIWGIFVFAVILSFFAARREFGFLMEDIVDREWVLRDSAGDIISNNLNFMPDGSIIGRADAGISRLNRWGMKDKQILLFGDDGTALFAFNTLTFHNRRLRIVDGKTGHMLSEVKKKSMMRIVLFCLIVLSGGFLLFLFCVDISKNNTDKLGKLAGAAVVVYVLLMWYQFGILQIWRFIRPLAQFSGEAVFIVIVAAGFLFIKLLLNLINYSDIETVAIAGTKDMSGTAERFFAGQKRLVVTVIAGIVCWGVWILPELNRVPSYLSGDEFYHFTVSRGTLSYLAQYIESGFPIAPDSGGAKYPSLMYLLYAPFAAINTPFMQRLPLILPFLMCIILTYLISQDIVGVPRISALNSLLVATSPLLLSLTSDKYLDIGHPAVFMFVCFGFYKSVKTGNIKWQVITAVSAGLLPLIKDNAVPTAFIAGAGLFYLRVKKFWTLQRSGQGVLLLAAACLPGVMYVFMKSQNVCGDAERLAFQNIYIQDYRLFFMFLALYSPIAFVFMSPLGLFRDKQNVLFAVFLLGSLTGQFFVYAMFFPGWIPWTRNYLMFYGQIAVCGIMGMSTALKYIRHGSWWIIFICFISLAFNLIFGALNVRKNVFFHELETGYPYDHLSEYINNNKTTFNNSEIYVHVPASMSKFRVNIPEVNVKIIPVSACGAAAKNSMMSFEEFEECLPASARYCLFHWRISRAHVPAAEFPKVRKPELLGRKNIRVIAEFSDARSDGNIGIMLFERKIFKD